MTDISFAYTDLSYAPFETEVAAPPPKAPPPPPPPKAPPAKAPPQYDVSLFNQQFEQQLRPVQQPPPPPPQEPSYWDRLFLKKKEVFKFVQSGLIILFAISLHFILDFVLKQYLETHDVSKTREMWIRALYPVGILFIAWNIIAFIPK